MKSLIVIALLFIITAATSEPFLLDIQQLAKTPFGEHLFNLVELQVEQGSKLAHVIDFIQKMLDELNQSQAADDLDFINKDTKFQETISKLQANEESLLQEQDINKRQIQQLSEDVASLTSAILSVKKQQQLLNTKEQELIDARNEEHLEFDTRQNKQLNNLKVIADILKRLGDSIVTSQSLVQLEREIDKIKKELGYNHPITLLVEVTSTFDESTVKRVIEKLEKIRDGISSQIQEEEVKENGNVQKFEVMMKQLRDIRERQDCSKSEQQVKIKQNDLILQKKKQGELNVDLENTKTLLLKTKSQSETFTSNYQARKRERNDEIGVVKLALSTLKQQS